MTISLNLPLDRIEQRPSLTSLFLLFLRVACVSFGGYMVMIAGIHNFVVERRKLLSEQELLNGVSLASILPGPIAINVVAYVGYRLRGGMGALVCVCAAVAPSFILMIALTMAYFHWGHIPAISKVFAGIVPVMTAIIMSAAWSMARKSISSMREVMLSVAAAIALLSIGGMYVSLAIIATAALVGRFWLDGATYASPTVPEEKTFVSDRSTLNAHFGVTLILLIAVSVSLISLNPNVLLKLFATFASMSMLLFGGAYVFIPLLQQTVVDAYGWVTQREFIDAVAMGQMMPGPVIVSAAFIGFKVAGIVGALVATIGIVMPSAIVMVWCARVLKGFVESKKVTATLRGLRAAIVGMIFAAAIQIGLTASLGWIAAMIFIVALGLLVRQKLEAIWLVPLGGLTGFLAY